MHLKQNNNRSVKMYFFNFAGSAPAAKYARLKTVTRLFMQNLQQMNSSLITPWKQERRLRYFIRLKEDQVHRNSVP